MKTLILYYSKYGTTEKCANILADKLGEGAEAVGYNNRKSIKLADYDTVIIGAPVYMGMLKKMKAYCEANLQILLTKKVGLFVCGLDKDTPLAERAVNYFPQKLLEHATAFNGFGGAYDTGKMKKFDKFIYEKVAKESGAKDEVKYDMIDKFAAKMAG